MQIRAETNQQQIHQLEEKLTQALKKLKKYPKDQDPNERHKIQKEVTKLYQKLEYLKFKAAY